MKKVKITLPTVEDVTRFVQLASLVEGEVTCMQGRYIVNGKSILAMFSLNTNGEIEVEYPANAENFTEFLENHTPNHYYY